MSAIQLLVLAMHETYPGHHAERCSKEHGLVRGRGQLEETLVLVPTPQSLVSEGIATLAPHVLLEGDAGVSLAAVVHDAGIEFDLAHALAVGRAGEPLEWAEVNAALMLHEAGASVAETQAYLERWALMTPKLADHLIRFLTQPTSRTYIVTYPAGRELCRSYVAGDLERFRRLLTEQVRKHERLKKFPDKEQVRSGSILPPDAQRPTTRRHGASPVAAGSESRVTSAASSSSPGLGSGRSSRHDEYRTWDVGRNSTRPGERWPNSERTPCGSETARER
jgi:hypothetical protein